MCRFSQFKLSWSVVLSHHADGESLRNELLLNPRMFFLSLCAAPVTAAHSFPPGASIQRSVCKVSPLHPLPEHPHRIGPCWQA